tara:strand:+ start:204 stop:434 length:231 start_codon:yes stop_codon:yes gene_type:complete
MIEEHPGFLIHHSIHETRKKKKNPSILRFRLRFRLTSPSIKNAEMCGKIPAIVSNNIINNDFPSKNCFVDFHQAGV